MSKQLHEIIEQATKEAVAITQELATQKKNDHVLGKRIFNSSLSKQAGGQIPWVNP